MLNMKSLNQLKKDYQLTNTRLCEILGITRQTLHKWNKIDYILTISYIHKLCAFLGMCRDNLMIRYAVKDITPDYDAKEDNISLQTVSHDNTGMSVRMVAQESTTKDRFQLLPPSDLEMLFPSYQEELRAKESENLKTGDITSVMGGNKVDSIYTDKEYRLREPNYVVDISHTNNIDKFKLESVHYLLAKKVWDENDKVYIYLKSDKGLYKLGFGEASKVHKLFYPMMSAIFGKDAVLYQDYKLNKNNEPMKGRDITRLRLDL